MEELLGQLEVVIATLSKEIGKEKSSQVTKFSEELIYEITKKMEEKEMDMAEALLCTLLVKYEIICFIGVESGMLDEESFSEKIETEEKSD